VNKLADKKREAKKRLGNQKNTGLNKKDKLSLEDIGDRLEEIRDRITNKEILKETRNQLEPIYQYFYPSSKQYKFFKKYSCIF